MRQSGNRGARASEANEAVEADCARRRWHALLVRVTVRVRPGASRTLVGGRYEDALAVRVQARAVDGKATKAALAALAKALGVPSEAVTLVGGAKNRTKVVDIPDTAAGRFTELRGS